MVGSKACRELLFLTLFLIIPELCARPQSVRLAVTNEDGIALKQVAAGQPFVLEVTIEGIRSNMQPYIHGLDDFVVEKQSMRMSVINGASTIIHRYSVIIDEPGTYRVGPVEVDDAGTTQRSSSIAIVVGKHVIENVQAAAALKRKEHAKKALLQVSCDKDTVVVGEKFTCYVRFLFRHQDISLQHIQVPEFEFLQERKSGPKTGKRVIDGVTYDYLEWEWDFVAQEAGRKRIPAFVADYIQQKKEDDILHDFHRMFHGFIDKKRIHSNPFTITVEPLPAFEHEVQAVGSFSNIRAFVDTAVASEGDGIVLTLELEGTGNMNMIESLPLTAIPQGFKAYPSKSYLVSGQPNKKRFEYILQVVQPGDWEIPSQEFYYFDVNERGYKRLASESVLVHIRAAQAQPKESRHDLSLMQTPQVAFQEQELAPPCVEFFYYPPAQWQLPWWLFLLFVLAPLSIVIYWLLVPALPVILGCCFPVIKKRQLRNALRKKLAYAQQHNDSALIHEVFITLFSYLAHEPREHITEEYIQKIFNRLGFTQEQYLEWQKFWHQINASLFAHRKQIKDTSTLSAQAYTWFNMLQQHLGKGRL